MSRCKSNHNHPGALTARICDQNLQVRYEADRAARPAQYLPIGEPTIRPTGARWLDRQAKDLTGKVGSN